MTFRVLLIGAAMIFLIGMALMAVAWLSGMRSADRLLHDISIEQRQLILVTRLEADVSAALTDCLASKTATPWPRTIQKTLSDYLDLVRLESASTGAGGDYQIEEQRMANELGVLLNRIGQGDCRVAPVLADFQRLRSLSHLIGARERREAEGTFARMEALRREAALTATMLALTSACFLLLAGIMLWRGVLRPIKALAEGTFMVTRGNHAGRVAVSGVAEFRTLAHRFNDMAAHIEAEVAARTDELKARNDQLARIDQNRKLFFSKVSHELRTPVTVIRGEADVALRHPAPDNEMLRDVLAHISANGAFLQRRLDDLLGLARSDDGQLLLAHEPFDLAAVCREALAIARPFALSSDVYLRGDIGPDALQMAGDGEWVRQALLTIIDNGVKFSPIDATVALTLTRDAGAAVITICDDGPGVDIAELPRLFDPYYQTQGGRSRGGTGLGLALARWVVDRHAGRIEAENGKEGGLMIRISLPLGA